MQAIVPRPRAGVPKRAAGRYVVNRNDGHQNQDVWYLADSLDELRAGGRTLIDPNTFSVDGTDSLVGLEISSDGQRVLYAVSEAGSDWLNLRVRDVNTGEDIDDAPIQTKFWIPFWLPDGASYVYTRVRPDGARGRHQHQRGEHTSADGAPHR